jgi:hypothetical protein
MQLPTRTSGATGSPGQAGRRQRAGHDNAAGRVCPADYRYDPAVFDRAADIRADVLYVVGGLYGNLAALEAVERLASAECERVTIVFNGDFHWFDAEPGWFAELDRRVARHVAMRGNVETEIARVAEIGAGCGCAYPESVDDGVVQRSNLILAELRAVASPDARQRLATLPMHLVARVGDVRIGVVHGDATALAGWRFDRAALDDPANQVWLGDVRSRSRIDAFASTHTCIAAARDFALPGGRLTVINNGAAGMSNFARTSFGLISRIATGPSPHGSVYGVVRDDVFFDAVAVPYDTAAFLARFLGRWPAGSPAHQSYFRRIMEGPDHSAAMARPAR